jgi:hypothetical protein
VNPFFGRDPDQAHHKPALGIIAGLSVWRGRVDSLKKGKEEEKKRTNYNSSALSDKVAEGLMVYKSLSSCYSLLNILFPIPRQSKQELKIDDCDSLKTTLYRLMQSIMVSSKLLIRASKAIDGRCMRP